MDSLLSALHEAHEKRFQGPADQRAVQQQLIGELVQKLVGANVMPAVGNRVHPVSAEQMVKCYGPFWFRFGEPTHCFACDADLRDHIGGPPFSRLYLVKVPQGKDFYRCPDCHHEFPCSHQGNPV
jgi:hypothetical protein